MFSHAIEIAEGGTASGIERWHEGRGNGEVEATDLGVEATHIEGLFHGESYHIRWGSQG